MDRKKASYIEGTLAIIGNVLLFVVKYWAGIVSGSIALMADAWHTLSDSISSVVVVLGAKLASKKPDKDHPFGHGRWELVSSIIIAMLLVLIAVGFIRESISQLQDRGSADFGTLAIVVTAISVLAKEAMAQYAFFLARRTGSSTVRADGWHHRTDALSSLIILIGILLKDYFWWIDGVLGLIVSLMLIYAAYDIMMEAVNKILGEEPGEELLREIHQIISSLYDIDLYPHHFHIHNYISSKELTFHIQIDGRLSVDEGHAIADAIEEEIREKLSITATIHMEPVGDSIVDDPDDGGS
jgi:cation diffusion facilitator family transporter